MTPPATYKEAIENKRFLEAEEIILRGDDILQSQFQFALSDTFFSIIQHNAFHVLKALIDKEYIEIDVFEYDSFRNTIFESLVLHLDGSDESITFLQEFINQVENLNDNLNDQTWLGLAFEQGAHPKVIETMIEYECDVHYKNNAEESVLQRMLSASNKNRLHNERILELIEIAIDNGIDVNHQNIMGKTALHSASASDGLDIIVRLLEGGADANIADKQGKTAYYIAIVEQQSIELTQKLAVYCPPDFNVETGKKTSLLYDFVASCHSFSISERELQFLTFFAENGADVHQINEVSYSEQQSVLDLMVKKNVELFRAFIDIFSIDVNHADNIGNTLLHKVCAVNLNFEADKAKDIYKKVKLLLKLGADPNQMNTQDKTAIDLASDDNLKEKTVALLLKH